MTTKNTLGIFWGNNSFSFVETAGNIPQKIFTAPFNLGSKTYLNLTTESTEGIKLTAIIQQALQNQRILESAINLALPAKDIIFRSFVIPYLQPSEIKNVVLFEAAKFVPFRMEDLAFTFHPVPFVDKGKKAIRIILVAVRKDILEGYCGILEHSGLRVECVEPSSVSFVRALTHKKLIQKAKNTAIIEIHQYEGRIIIVDQNIPQFVREFQLYPTSAEASSLASDILSARLFNEIKISFEYYGRQYNQKKVERIIALSGSEDDAMLKNLGKDFNLSCTVITTKTFFKNDAVDMGAIHAYGSSLRGAVQMNFDFSLPRQSLATAPVEETAPVQVSGPNYAAVALVGIFCLAIFALTVNFSNGLIKKYQNKTAELQSKFGSYATSTPELLEQQTTESKGKLAAYRNIRIGSKVSYFLKLVPALLPEGAWLKDLDIRYNDIIKNEGSFRVKASKVTLSFSGYIYTEDPRKQFPLANTLLLNFKNNKEFSNLFDRIELGSVQRTALQQYNVTTFRIECR